MSELEKGIQSMLEAANVAKPHDRAMIIADNDGRCVWLGQILMNSLASMGAEAVLSIIDTDHLAGGEGAAEPPDSVAAGMKCVNTVIRVSDKGSLAMVHSNARKEATKVGVRYITVGAIPLEDLKRGVKAADLQAIKERTESLAEKLSHTNVARVTTAAGTDVTMSLKGRPGVALHPLSPLVAGLPYYAEAAIAPVEGSAQGVIVADLAIIQWGYRLREPLRITVKDGKAVSVSPSTPDAERLRKILATHENSPNIGELGIGTSHTIPWPMHGTRSDAGRIGTAHFGIGRNNDIGGQTWCPTHVDSVMDKVSIELDGQYVLKNGTLII